MPSGLADHPDLAGIARLESAPITSVHLWFDRPITPLPHAVFVGRLCQWMFQKGVGSQESGDRSVALEPGPLEGSKEALLSPDSRLLTPAYYQIVISASRVLADVPAERTIQAVVDENIAFPIVIGRSAVVTSKIQHLGLRLRAGIDFELVDPQDDPRYRDYWQFYHRLVSRRGVSVSAAREAMRTNSTVIAASLLAKDDADAMICGTVGRFDHHLQHIIEIIGPGSADRKISSMSVLILSQGPLFIADAHIEVDPDAEQIVNTTLACAERISDFGLRPKIALLSHSNFGSSRAPGARKMRDAVTIIRERAPHLEVDGEMHAISAMNETIRNTINPYSTLSGAANLLIMPNLDTANIAMELLRAVNNALLIGPILSGAARPAHIVTPTATAKGIFNMSALAVADAWRHKNRQGVAEVSRPQDYRGA
jgi:malate dehydrogenase (oxaloacetate-decarboxylating)(NADP+)